MKKIVQALVICSFLVVSSSMSFAVTTCGQMQIQLVEAAGMWLKNVTGSACGKLANNAEIRVLFNETQGDRQLSVGLTAFSLDKVVWANFEGDGSQNNQILNVVSVRR